MSNILPILQMDPNTLSIFQMGPRTLPILQIDPVSGGPNTLSILQIERDIFTYLSQFLTDIDIHLLHLTHRKFHCIKPKSKSLYRHPQWKESLFYPDFIVKVSRKLFCPDFYAAVIGHGDVALLKKLTNNLMSLLREPNDRIANYDILAAAVRSGSLPMIEYIYHEMNRIGIDHMTDILLSCIFITTIIVTDNVEIYKFFEKKTPIRSHSGIYSAAKYGGTKILQYLYDKAKNKQKFIRYSHWGYFNFDTLRWMIHNQIPMMLDNHVPSHISEVIRSTPLNLDCIKYLDNHQIPYAIGVVRRNFYYS